MLVRFLDPLRTFMTNLLPICDFLSLSDGSREEFDWLRAKSSLVHPAEFLICPFRGHVTLSHPLTQKQGSFFQGANHFSPFGTLRHYLVRKDEGDAQPSSPSFGHFACVPIFTFLAMNAAAFAFQFKFSHFSSHCLVGYFSPAKFSTFLMFFDTYFCIAMSQLSDKI